MKHHIIGILADLILGGISHIQYADDTVIMIDGSIQSVVNLKLILYCFEWLSGLKINYHKSDVYGFGMDQGEKGSRGEGVSGKHVKLQVRGVSGKHVKLQVRGLASEILRHSYC